MRSGVCLVMTMLALAGCKSNDTGGGTAGTSVPLGGAGAGTGSSGIMGGVSGTTPAGGSGAPSTTGGIPGCEAADATVTGKAAHDAALMVLNGMSPCGFGSCHMGTGKAKLVLLGVTDLKATLVGKASCELPSMPLVDSKGGQAGLSNSWLWQKLTVPVGGDTALIPLPAWGTTMASCGQTTGVFGVRMPYGLDSMSYLETPRLAAIRNWICAGAPGPQ